MSDRDAAMLRHPSMVNRLRRRHEDDQFDAWADEAMNLANSSRPFASSMFLAEMFVAIMAGGVTGAAVFAALMVVAL